MAGDWEGFEDWYGAIHPRVLGVLAGVCGSVDAAAEATDEAFARALTRWDRVRGLSSPEGWVYRVGLNLVRRRMRRRALDARVRPTEATVEAVYPQGHVWERVRELAPRQRTAVFLRYVADLPEVEIAAVMRVSRGTVASTLADARHRLARSLASEMDAEMDAAEVCRD